MDFRTNENNIELNSNDNSSQAQRLNAYYKKLMELNKNNASRENKSTQSITEVILEERERK